LEENCSPGREKEVMDNLRTGGLRGRRPFNGRNFPARPFVRTTRLNAEKELLFEFRSGSALYHSNTETEIRKQFYQPRK